MKYTMSEDLSGEGNVSGVLSYYNKVKEGMVITMSGKGHIEYDERQAQLHNALFSEEDYATQEDAFLYPVECFAENGKTLGIRQFRGFLSGV